MTPHGAALISRGTTLGEPESDSLTAVGTPVVHLNMGEGEAASGVYGYQRLRVNGSRASGAIRPALKIVHFTNTFGFASSWDILACTHTLEHTDIAHGVYGGSVCLQISIPG